ncbi:MAG: nucleotidyltransferase family protein [Myxococcota bacterium]|nr:nucleotidyltransferase family protein [Myxococcota bacterium]
MRPFRPGMMRPSAVLLAAGGSRRLGRPKQLLVEEGEALVRRAARAALDAGVEEVVVVLGAHAAEVADALAGLALRTVENADWRAGLGSSIACGVRAAEGDAVLLLLADQPGVDAALLRRLLAAARAGHRRVACAYDDVRGVPALFSDPDDLARLAELSGDRGARTLLAARPDSVHAIDAPEAAFDIDDEADWARWRGRGPHGFA